jgi:hypothetical protein
MDGGDSSFDCDFLGSLNPLFKLSESMIYWCDQVEKLGHQNQLHPRLFVIASFGVFLVRRKSFNFQSHIVCGISFHDLISLSVTADYAVFRSAVSKIRIKHEKRMDIANIAYVIRVAQFSPEKHRLEVNGLDPVKALRFVYKPSSLFFDRALSCAVHFNACTYLGALGQIPVPRGQVIEIGKDDLASPVLPTILLSLAYDRTLTQLKLIDLSLSTFLTQAGPLFQWNSTIKTIWCDRTDFTDAATPFAALLNDPHSFRPSDWVFKKCDIAKTVFVQFFETIPRMGGPIRRLEFKHCTISEQVFRSVFEAIFFNECFHSLQIFSAGGQALGQLTECVCHLTCCRWAMESKCLRRIALKDCGVDGTSVIAQLLQFDVGLREISLDGSDCSKPLPALTKVTICELTYLRLSNAIKMSPAFLNSLFEVLHSYSIGIKALDLSALPLSHDDFSSVLTRMSGETIKDLRALAFDKNRMQSTDTLCFLQFLERQPALTALSLNCSVDASDSPSGLTGLIQFLSKHPLNFLSLRGDDSIKFSFGPLLVPLLTCDIFLESITHLDIRHQSVGLEVLAKLLDQRSLAILHFDGCGCASADALCRFCERVIASPLTFASFPTADFDRFERLVDRHAPADRREKVARLFQGRFGMGDGGWQAVVDAVAWEAARRRFQKGRMEDGELDVKQPEQEVCIGEDWEDVRRVCDSVLDLYRKCVGADRENDLMAEVIGVLEESTSFETLLSEIP